MKARNASKFEDVKSRNPNSQTISLVNEMNEVGSKHP